MLKISECSLESGGVDMKAMVKITGNQMSSEVLLSVWKDHTILLANGWEMNQFTDLNKSTSCSFPKICYSEL